MAAGERVFGSEACNECGRRYADLAMARVLQELGTVEMPKESWNATFKALTGVLMGLGVASFPLSLKAYKEACWAKGWNEGDVFGV